MVKQWKYQIQLSSEVSTNEATAIINFNEMIDINEVESVDIMGKIFEI